MWLSGDVGAGKTGEGAAMVADTVDPGDGPDWAGVDSDIGSEPPFNIHMRYLVHTRPKMETVSRREEKKENHPNRERERELRSRDDEKRVRNSRPVNDTPTSEIPLP